MKRNVLLIPHMCHYSQKDFKQDVGHSSDWGQKQSGTPLTKKDQEENGIESLNWWWSTSETADTQFSEPRVRCLEERSKAKEVENYLFTSVSTVIRWKLFFAQLFLSISSVSTICLASTGRLIVAGQSDPFFAPADSLIMTPTHFLSTKNKWKTFRNQIEKTFSWQIPENIWSLHDKTYWRVLTICRACDMSWVCVTTRWQINWPERLDSREHQNWTRKVNTEWKSELNLRTKTILTRGSISHGLNKLVTDSIDKEYDDNEQETSTTKTYVCAFASRSKAKEKPRMPSAACSSSRTIPILGRNWIDIEPGARFDQAYPVAKR